MSNKWNKWPGGERPVDGQVEVTLRSGNQGKVSAEGMSWRHGLSDDDIVAYRVVSDEPDEPQGNDGGPAFPAPLPDRSGQWRSTAVGLTMCDWFAGQALCGLLAADAEGQYTVSATVCDAYAHAAEMIAERANGGAV